MPITHHLDDATLMSFAAGSLPEALAAVVACHIDVCAQCAAEARRMDLIGGALLAAVKPSHMAGATPVMQLRRGEADTASGTPLGTPVERGVIPAPLSRVVGGDLDQLAWKRLGYGIWHVRLATTRGDLRLLKVSPGRHMPEHGHGGDELTLMLRGSYSDQTGTYRPGDVADLDADVEHRPVADAVTGCICLIASEGPARFKGIIPRIVQPLTGI